MTQPVIDLSRNPKQWEFFLEVSKASNGLSPFRKFHYGGAIRGGKTFIILGCMIRLADRFPGSKGHVIRDDFPNLQATTIPSLEKIIKHSPNWKWNREKANYFAYHKNDSKIYFKPENYARDPELNDFLGLETNWIFYEQIEQLKQKTYEIGNSRLGSWYIDPMPPAMAFSSFNPTQLWPKQEFYLKYINGTLPKDVYFQTALPSDNAFVTDDQWSNWGNMGERYQKQFIQGDWTNFDETDNRFAYCYNPDTHLGEVVINPKHHIILSFDFNVDPITCFVCQIINDNLFGIEQISLGNSDIYKLCEYIKVKYGKYLLVVTGDASGENRSAMVKDNLNYYKIIRGELGIAPTALKVPKSNPKIEENRVLVNAVLHRTKPVFDKKGCAALDHDLLNLRVSPDGGIDKSDKSLGHATDCFRYVCNTFLKHILKT